MAIEKRVRGNPIPLIIENHPDTYEGYPFITLIQYRDQHHLTIVDNATQKTIKVFALDLCGPEQVNEETIINVANQWYLNNKDRYPLSFEFSRLQLSEMVEKVYRTFNIEFVTRVIGPLPKFEMAEVHKIKRRRRKVVPIGMEIHDKRILI
jgi:hypothetical protein